MKARLWKCLTALLLGFIWLPEASFAGAITGKIVLVGPAPAPKKIEITTDQYVCGGAKDAEDLLLSPRKDR